MKNFKKYLLLILIVFCIFGITNVNAKTVCKRATKLHKEVCNATSAYSVYTCSHSDNGHSKGSDVVYGNYGNSASLALGDALDCDVNSDGIFDPYKERFYYVTPLNTNSNYAVLLYYNNTYNGIANAKNNKVHYHDKGISVAAGPEVAKSHLPTTSLWNNVALSSTIRNITIDNGTTIVPNFSYEGFAARLLTLNELKSVDCWAGVGKPQCEFIKENTKYTYDFFNSAFNYTTGYWLETQFYAAQSYMSYKLDAEIGTAAGGWTPANAELYGVRPAIEVKLDEIDTTLREHEENIYADQEQDTSKDSTNSTNKREEVVSVPDTAASVSKIILINAIICILVGITIISLNTIHKKKNKS
ncbi:MAG: hypothetical protein IKG58_04395 [Bacilli bacterium]|nr:hypothetical protein [Bacilli bacterium]MBR3049775.1 hypothetical protein [Bacilli bacterium]